MVATDLLDGLEGSPHVIFDVVPVFSGFQLILHGLGALSNDVSMGCCLVHLAALFVLVVLIHC